MKKNNIINKNVKGETLKQENWNQEIKELEDFFEMTFLPATLLGLNSNIEWSLHFVYYLRPAPLMRLNPFTKLIDVPLFIHSHLAIVKANNGNRIFASYHDRLKELKKYLIISQTDLKTITSYYEFTDK